jgi:toluene monooxygenase electron transfer component
MCNLPDGGQWHFIVKRMPGGAGTATLFDQLGPGATVTIDGPYGRAYLRTDSARDIVCIAGGSGLSPVLAVARGMARTPSLANARLHFFYGGRGPRDICGEAQLAELPGYGERIRYYPAISMPELDVDRAWAGDVGFIHDVVARALGARLPEHEIYFAGPPAMAQAVQRMLIQHRVPLSQMHFDSFY